MIVKIVRRGKTEVITDASLLIVEDHKGDPVSLAVRFGAGPGFTVSCIDNEDKFNQVLRNLGIDKVVIKVPIDPLLKPPAQLPVLQ